LVGVREGLNCWFELKELRWEGESGGEKW